MKNNIQTSLVHILSIPAAFLASVLLYEPRALCELMQTGEGVSPVNHIYSFNIAISFAIILGTMVLSRMLLFILRKQIPLTLWRYCFWCLGETLVFCAFVALYLVLTARNDDSWFSFWGRSISSIGSIVMVAYILLIILYSYLDARDSDSSAADARLKFYDNRHQLKFITEASSVLYIESNENYIVLHYLENGIEKRFQIRNSMKNIEPLCEQAGFARTHRCFIVNPAHIKTIRKDPGGVNFADLGCERSEGIPISKKYYDNITSLL